MADTDSGNDEASEREEGNNRPQKSQGSDATKPARLKSGTKPRNRSSRNSSSGRAGGVDRDVDRDGEADGRNGHHSPDHGPRVLTGAQAARRAARELVELTNKDLEGVVGIRKDGDSWTVEIEAVEMRRIPSTTDVLAVYEVSLDAAGELIGYERVARYVRGDAGEDRS